MADIAPSANDRIKEGFKSLLSVNFRGKRFVVPIMLSFVSEAKFRTNKVLNWAETHRIDSKHPNTGNIDELNYFVGRDEQGYLRGGDIPWEYLQGLCDTQITPKHKREHLNQMIAQLPPDVSFVLKADPNLRDKDFVRQAFTRAGFVNKPRTTLLYRGALGQDPLSAVRPDTRTKVRSARRDLEFATMDADSFFEHYRKNLGEKTSHFYLNIDHALMKEAVEAEKPLAEIIAVRRKTNDPEQPQPIEAAIVTSTGSDGYLRFMRISFRRAAEAENAPPPHPHALKMVVLEAMQRATDRNLALDVDGCTPGGKTLYERFGCFNAFTHDQYVRTPAQHAFGQLADRLAQAFDFN